VKTDYFLITLETSIGRHQRRTVALMARDTNKTTRWLWHRPEPLIDAITLQTSGGSKSSDGTGESTEPQ
jgi:hypothetical protein